MSDRLVVSRAVAPPPVDRKPRRAKQEVSVYQPSGGGGTSRAGSEVYFSSSNSEDAYWVPDAKTKGLLEVLYNVGKQDRVPVCSRPALELAKNFDDFEGNAINLNHPIITHGRIKAMQQQLVGMHDNAVISGRDFKGIAGGLPEFMENSYLLVSYKDFSPWAVAKYPKESHTKGWYLFGKKYVLKYFAIEMGAQPGVFIEISETQFIVGSNKLHESRCKTPQRMMGHPSQPLFECLSLEQFRALQSAANQEEMRHVAEQIKHKEEGTGFWPPWTWWQRWRDEKYRQIGANFVWILGFGVGACLLWVYIVRPLVRTLRPPQKPQRYRRQVEYRGGGGFGLRDFFETILST